jgi:hypothetical protein
MLDGLGESNYGFFKGLPYKQQLDVLQAVMWFVEYQQQFLPLAVV